MRKTILLALALVGLFTANAEARPHRHHHRGHHVHARHRAHTDNRVRVPAVDTSLHGFFSSFSNSLVAEARSQLGNGAIYGRANLWCARFVNFVLKATGHTGTGSDAAASFAHYGRPVSGPQVGAIAVMSRRGGGHVGIVSGVNSSGDPVVISGNHGGRVREAVYPRGRIYAYVMPS